MTDSETSPLSWVMSSPNAAPRPRPAQLEGFSGKQATSDERLAIDGDGYLSRAFGGERRDPTQRRRSSVPATTTARSAHDYWNDCARTKATTSPGVPSDDPPPPAPACSQATARQDSPGSRYAPATKRCRERERAARAVDGLSSLAGRRSRFLLPRTGLQPHGAKEHEQHRKPAEQIARLTATMNSGSPITQTP